jgi:hypothetical protein
MVTELSSSEEPKPKQGCDKATKLMRNEWNALTPEEKKTRIRRLMQKGKKRDD